MTRPLITVARRFADVLDQENAALEAMDLPRAAALLDEKSAAMAELSAHQDNGAARDPALLPMARLLDDLVRRNRMLLTRAIAAQQRVIGIVVRAAASATPAPAYDAKGLRGRPGALALSTRA